MKGKKTLTNISNEFKRKYSSGLRRTILIGLLSSSGLILHFIESLLPVWAPVPGAKLGLANIITLVAIVLLGVKGGGQVLMLRIFLGALLAGTFLTFPFYLSLSGGVLALTAMSLGYTFGRTTFSLVGISLIGAVAHNIGQLLATVLFVGSWGVFYYFPFLVLMAIPAGFLVGITAHLIIRQFSSLRI